MRLLKLQNPRLTGTPFAITAALQDALVPPGLHRRSLPEALVPERANAHLFCR